MVTSLSHTSVLIDIDIEDVTTMGAETEVTYTSSQSSHFQGSKGKCFSYSIFPRWQGFNNISIAF